MDLEDDPRIKAGIPPHYKDRKLEGIPEAKAFIKYLGDSGGTSAITKKGLSWSLAEKGHASKDSFFVILHSALINRNIPTTCISFVDLVEALETGKDSRIYESVIVGIHSFPTGVNYRGDDVLTKWQRLKVENFILSRLDAKQSVVLQAEGMFGQDATSWWTPEFIRQINNTLKQFTKADHE